MTPALRHALFVSMTPWRRQPDTRLRQTACQFHPRFIDAAFRVWWGDAGDSFGTATLEGGDVLPDRSQRRPHRHARYGFHAVRLPSLPGLPQSRRSSSLALPVTARRLT